MQFNLLIIEHNVFCSELHSYCRFALRIELVLGDPTEDLGFAYCGVPNKNDLVEVIMLFLYLVHRSLDGGG